MTRRASVACCMVALLVCAGCASNKKWGGKGTLYGSLAGMAVGGGAGVGVAYGIDQDRPSQVARDGAIGAAVGLVIGGVIGHYLFDEDLAPPAPAEVPVAIAEPVEPVEVEPLGRVIAVIDVSNFGFNQSTVPPAAYDELDALAAQLQQRPTEQLVLEGHTDSIGSESYNYALGLRRAEAVRTYLAAHGVERDRMAVRSQGKLVPIASNDTPEGRAKNRRVEVRSLGAAEAAAPPPVEAVPAAPVEGEPVPAAEPAAVAPEELPAVEGEVAPAAEAPAAAPVVDEGEAVLLEPAPEVAPDAAGQASQVVLFTVEQYDLNPQAVQVLDNVVAYLREHPNAVVAVTGHTDGVVEINPSTAGLRSERVKMYLVSRGVAPRRITTSAVGATQPADPSGSPEALVKNRRVDVVITNGTP